MVYEITSYDKPRKPEICRTARFFGAGAMGFVGEHETLEAIERHVRTDHMIGMGHKNRGLEISRHYAAIGRGEITLEQGKLVIKKAAS